MLILLQQNTFSSAGVFSSISYPLITFSYFKWISFMKMSFMFPEINWICLKTLHSATVSFNMADLPYFTGLVIFSSSSIEE